MSKNMTTIHLLIEDDFVEEFISGLPRDKVTVIEEDFKENQQLLQAELQNYLENRSVPVPFYESMKELDIWLKERQI